MAIKHNTQIQKLSTAIERGKQIADEVGIKHTRKGFWLKPNKAKTKIECACALGMALIGKLGVKKCTEMATVGGYALSRVVALQFPQAAEVNSCLIKAVKAKNEKVKPQCWYPVSGIVLALNDETKMPVEEIAETLKSCKL